MLLIKRLSLFVVAVLAATLTFVLPAQAADGPNLFANGDLEIANGTQPAGWAPSQWPANPPWTYAFDYSATGAHSGSRSVKVTITGYSAPGDAKWIVEPDPVHPGEGVPVEPGKYYTFSDWYKSNASTVVSVWYRLASDPAGSGGHWATLFSGVPPKTEWTEFTTGFTMPAGVTRAYFAHFIAGNGWLQTDDYSMRQSDAPTGFSHPMFSLTFDNGSHGTYERALPEMDERGLTSTQYFPTDGFDPFDDWMMTPAQIRTIAAKHEIGSHSITHPYLTQVSPTQLDSELRGSQSALGQILGSQGSVVSFAYPYGDYNATVIAALGDHGYTSGRAVDEGYNSPANLNAYALKVQNVTPATTVAQFESWVNQAIDGNYWLIVVYHEVLPDIAGLPLCSVEDTDPCQDDYDTYLSTFRAMMDYLRDHGPASNVVTVSKGLRAATNGFPTGTVTIAGETGTNSVLTAQPAFTDPDPDDTLTYSYQWLVDGQAIPGAVGKTLDLSQPGHGDHGDVVSVRVTANDGYAGSATADASVTVDNTAPTAGTAAITPSAPREGATLTARPSGFGDADGDTLTYSYRWLRNGAALAGQTAATLPGSLVRAGATIRVEIRATDGHGGMTAVAAATVKPTAVAPSPPADVTEPVIVIRSPKSGRVYRQGRRLTVRFACTDEAGTVHWKATLHRRHGGTRKVKPGKTVRLARAGRYVLRVSAWDQAGNTTVKTIRFRVA